MKGKVYKYPLMIDKLHRFFINYENKKGQYVEENFDLRRDAEARIAELAKQNIGAELWTRERAMRGKEAM